MAFRTLLRWTATAVFGGAGLYLLGYAARVIWLKWPAHWAIGVFSVVFALVPAALLLLIAYCTASRRYQTLCAIGCALGSLAICGGVVLAVTSFEVRHNPSSNERSLWHLARLCFALVCFVFAFRFSQWLNDRSFQFLSRYIKDEPPVRALPLKAPV